MDNPAANAQPPPDPAGARQRRLAWLGAVL